MAAKKSEIWTHSRLKMLMNCPMAEHLRYDLEIAPVRKKKALSLGSAIHRGLETGSVQEALMEYDGFHTETPEDEDELLKMKAITSALLNGYFKRYEPFDDQKPELTFSLPVIIPDGRQSAKHRLCGKIDNLVKIGGEEWLVEYKTAAASIAGRQSYFDRLYVDDQITTYMYAARRMGYKPVGVIYRVIKKPSLKWKTGQSYLEYLKEIETDIENRPDFYYLHAEFYRKDDDLKRFEDELYQKIHNAMQLKDKNICWRNTGACTGMYQCEYLPMCCGFNVDGIYENRPAHDELTGVEEDG